MLTNLLADAVIEVSVDIMVGVGVVMLTDISFIAVVAAVVTLLEFMMSVSEYVVDVLVDDV